MSDIDARDFGRLESDVLALKSLIEEIKSDVKELKQAQAEMTGGTKVLLGMAAVLGAGLSQVIGWLVSKFH
jgi:archaellum component FlaC